jgi:hypothetical protein
LVFSTLFLFSAIKVFEENKIISDIIKFNECNPYREGWAG